MSARPQSIPRRLYRYVRDRRTAREEGGFVPRLRVEEGAPELILSPHFDDAVLDCWGVIAGPGAVEVVNVFAAAPDPGTVTLWDSITGAGTPPSGWQSGSPRTPRRSAWRTAPRTT
jgi:hypothetical protein